MKTTFFITLICSILLACNNTNTDNSNQTQNTIPNLNYTITNVFPHDTIAFTEGLVWYKNQLFESTGEAGYSTVRKVDFKTGNIQQKINIDKQLFGEGITILDDKIYQLTWKNKIGFVYDVKSMHQIQTFTLESEGWGITSDNKHLILSDGSSNLYFLDPHTFQKLKTISVIDNNGPVNNINELEFIKGYIYANRWQTNSILKIDTANGKVLAQADFSNVLDKYGKGYDPSKIAELNGIAYDSINNRVFITGKRWPWLFEARFDN